MSNINDFDLINGGVLGAVGGGTTAQDNTLEQILGSLSNLGSGANITEVLGSTMDIIFPGVGTAINLLSTFDFLGVFGGLGDIFANGFDFSCFGASYTSAEMSNTLQNHVLPEFQALVADVQNSSNLSQLATNLTAIDKYSNFFSNFWYNKLKANNWSNCTKKAYEMAYQSGLQFQAKVVELTSTLGQVYKLSATEKLQSFQTKENYSIGDYSGQVMNYQNTLNHSKYKAYYYKQYTVTAKNVTNGSNSGSDVGSNGGGVGSASAKSNNGTNLVLGIVLAKIFKLW